MFIKSGSSPKYDTLKSLRPLERLEDCALVRDHAALAMGSGGVYNTTLILNKKPLKTDIHVFISEEDIGFQVVATTLIF